MNPHSQEQQKQAALKKQKAFNLWVSEFRPILDAYKQSVWSLADSLAKGEKHCGYNIVREFIPFDQTKLRWLLALSRMEARHPNLLPEHHAELICDRTLGKKDHAGYWLKRATELNLKPAQLRKHLRGIGKPKQKQMNIAKWPRHLIILQQEINRLPKGQREVALQQMKQQLSL